MPRAASPLTGVHPTQVRLPRELRAYAAFVAARDGVTMADVIRDALNAQLDAEPPLENDLGEAAPAVVTGPQGKGLPLRSLMKLLSDDSIEELAARSREQADRLVGE